MAFGVVPDDNCVDSLLTVVSWSSGETSSELVFAGDEGAGRRVVNTKSFVSGSKSITIVSPSFISPLINMVEIGFSTNRCIVRRKGRAPYIGSNPTTVNSSFTASEISMASSCSSSICRNDSICNSTMASICWAVKGLKTMTSSNRFNSSGLKNFLNSSRSCSVSIINLFSNAASSLLGSSFFMTTGALFPERRADNSCFCQDWFGFLCQTDDPTIIISTPLGVNTWLSHALVEGISSGWSCFSWLAFGEAGCSCGNSLLL